MMLSVTKSAPVKGNVQKSAPVKGNVQKKCTCKWQRPEKVHLLKK